MTSCWIGNEDICCVWCIELVDLEPAIKYRYVPFQKVNEDALPRFEHCSERMSVQKGMIVRNRGGLHDGFLAEI